MLIFGILRLCIHLWDTSFLVFVDDFTSYPIVLKSDVLTVLHQFKALVECEFNTTIKDIQSDWGGKFRSVSPVLNKLGISHRDSCPHTHEQEGGVERKH